MAPVPRRGVTEVPGLYVLGLPFLSRRASSFIFGVEQDAARLAEHINAALLREHCAGGGLPAGRGINRSGWLLAYRSLSSDSAHCIQSLLRPADWTESGRGVAVQ